MGELVHAIGTSAVKEVHEVSKSGTSMRTRKPLLILAAAIVAASSISYFWKPVPYSEQLIHIQAEQELGHIDKRIADEPPEVQAVLLDHSRDKEFVLKAWIALSKYPKEAREILSLYGSEPEFQEILKAYGESVVPVIQYFRENDIWTVKARDAGGKVVQWVTGKLGTLRRRVTGNEQTSSNPVEQSKPRERDWSDERGWYAVNFIGQEGHDFLGQFVVTRDGKAKRSQIERLLEAITSFFTSGLRTIEIKYILEEEIAKSDVFWAGLDVAVVAAPLKVLGAGKVIAGSGKELNLTTRTRVFAPRLVSKAKVFRKIGKYGAVAATTYIIATNPSLINSVLGEIAKLLGLPSWLAQFAGWFLIVALVLYPFSWLLKGVARFILFVLSWLEQSRKKSILKNSPTPAPT